MSGLCAPRRATAAILPVEARGPCASRAPRTQTQTNTHRYLSSIYTHTHTHTRARAHRHRPRRRHTERSVCGQSHCTQCESPPPSHSARCHTRHHKRKQLTAVSAHTYIPVPAPLTQGAEGTGRCRCCGASGSKAQFGVYAKQNLETKWPGASKSGSGLHHALSARPAKAG